jgi:hypothetical protein
VTRLGEFSPIERLFSLAVFSITQKLKFLGYLFYTRQVLTKSVLGYTLGDFFTNSSGHTATTLCNDLTMNLNSWGGGVTPFTILSTFRHMDWETFKMVGKNFEKNLAQISVATQRPVFLSEKFPNWSSETIKAGPFQRIQKYFAQRNDLAFIVCEVHFGHSVLKIR